MRPATLVLIKTMSVLNEIHLEFHVGGAPHAAEKEMLEAVTETRDKTISEKPKKSETEGSE